MAENKLNIFFIFIFIYFFSNLLFANPNADQWMDSDKSYKDLVNEGFEVKGYGINTGHYLAEENPDEIIKSINNFFK